MKSVVKFPDKHRVSEEAAEWLIRLDSELPPDDDELKALHDWLKRSPVHRKELECLAALWNRMNVLTELSVPVAKARAGGIAGFRLRDLAPRGIWTKKYAVWGVAAASAFIMVTALTVRNDTLSPAESGVYETGVGQQSNVSLSDGSSVVLNTNTRINVDYDQQYRNVYLSQGEALFTVAEIANLPFRVYAGSGRIEALGTAFSVRLNREAVLVTVTDGRVSLATATSQVPGDVHGRSGGVSRSPRTTAHGLVGDAFRTVGRVGAGQVATIYATRQMVPTGEIATPTIESVASDELARQLAWRDGILLFSGDTLGDVVNELGRYTTITIEVPDEDLRNMRVGGRFPIGETEAMLGALETNFDLRIERPNRNLVILTSGRE